MYWKLPTDLGLPPLKMKHLLESNPLKSRVLACELTILAPAKPTLISSTRKPYLAVISSALQRCTRRGAHYAHGFLWFASASRGVSTRMLAQRILSLYRCASPSFEPLQQPHYAVLTNRSLNNYIDILAYHLNLRIYIYIYIYVALLSCVDHWFTEHTRPGWSCGCREEPKTFTLVAYVRRFTDARRNGNPIRQTSIPFLFLDAGEKRQGSTLRSWTV